MHDKPAASGGVPGNAAGQPVDDGTGKECIPDPAFIADAAEDAARVEAWRAWCTLNKCSIE